MGQNKRQQVQTPQTKELTHHCPCSYFGDLEPSLVVCRTEVSWSPKWRSRTARKLQDGTGIVKVLSAQILVALRRSSIYVANWYRIAKRLRKSSHERDCKLAETCDLQWTLEQWKKIKKISYQTWFVLMGVLKNWETGETGVTVSEWTRACFTPVHVFSFLKIFSP